MGSEPIFESTAEVGEYPIFSLRNEFTRRPVKVTSLLSPAALVTVKV